MKGKDITLGLDVAFHPSSTSSSKYQRPYRGKVIKLVAKGDLIEVKTMRSRRPVEVRMYPADIAMFEVECIDVCDNGDWGSMKVGAVCRVTSAKVWRPWDEEKTLAEVKAAAQVREERRRLSTWAAYDATVADINADLAGTGIDLSAIWKRQEWNRSYRDAPSSVDVPVELIARMAAR